MRNLCLLLLIFISSTVVAQHGTIVGTITDKDGGDPLPFASIVVKGTTIGTTTDINGKYTLPGIPVGKQQIDFGYLGYQTLTQAVTIVHGKSVEQNVKLGSEAIQGKEVVVYGQARGQTQAINQQLNSPGIVNVVSIEKMRELPDANAAEAVGRLPGIMVQRNGGEGEKVIIRGLDPKYSTVAINGVVAPSSSATDRSTNMNLISPEIISGIEVSKANTADRDADGMGGTVNMIVKEADAARKLNVSLQGGYSGQVGKVANTKAVLFYNDRFFNKKLGMMLSGNFESYDRSSDQMRVSYEVSGDPTPPATFVQPRITNEKLQSNLERRNRYNASAIFDMGFGRNHVVKMVNMYSQTDRDTYVRNKTFSMDNGQLRFSQTDAKPTSYMISNAFDGKHLFGTTELTWGASRSETNARNANEHQFEFRHSSGILDPAATSLLDPLFVPNPTNLNENIKDYNLYNGVMLDTRNRETEWSAKADLKVPVSMFENKLSGFIKFGGKARFKTRERNTDRWVRRLDGTGGLNAMKNRSDYEASSVGGLGVMSFLDNNFSTSNFLNGIGDSYLNVNYALDRDVVRRFYEINNPNPRGETGNLYRYSPAAKVKDDYSGSEDMYAAYLMGEFNIGKMITFIPGVRFDHSYINYMAYVGDDIPDSYDSDVEVVNYTENWDNYKQSYFLPQIHLKIKPTGWFDARLAYTQTLSRPDYDYIAPRTQISPTSATVKYTTPKLNSSKSENFDLILSFYKPKYGLLTVGGFHKNIQNFIYSRTAVLTIGTDTDPANFGLQPIQRGYKITYPRNNPANSTISGIEIEGQTNFRWAPMPFTGLVLSGNLTLMQSRSSYQATLFETIANPNYGQIDPITGALDRRRNIVVNKDTSYVDRLIKQPSILANVSVGYDIKGFSARLSFSHQADVLNSPQTRVDGADKEITMAFSRWDLQLKQKVGKKVSLFFNMTNLFNCPDRAIREVTGYYSSIEYYGMGANLGVKVDIF